MGAYTLLQDLTVATNSTSVVLNDFGTITKDDFIKIVVTFQNGTGGSTDSNYFLHVNGNTTAADYRYQRLRGFSSSVAADRGDNALIGFAQRDAGAEKSQSFIYCKLTENDFFTHFANTNIDDTGSNLQLQFIYSTSEVTFTSGVTSLTITASATNGIGTGSRIQIYKLAATKVRDIIVETNSTQVDIPTTGIFDPAIDKDSEYLLVSDINALSSISVTLTPNDLTTITGYHRQRIRADGSTANADRFNGPEYITSSTGNSLAYTHIKISNIGAFTFQSYNMRNIGLSSCVLQNFFGSSTAENITSITKLNIVSNTTNSIGSGSRFILYKLYE